MQIGIKPGFPWRHKRLEVTEHHQIANVLDPRLKTLAFASREERELIYAKIIEKLKIIADKAAEKPVEASEPAPSNFESCFGIDRFYNFGSLTNALGLQIDVKREFDSYTLYSFSVSIVSPVACSVI